MRFTLAAIITIFAISGPALAQKGKAMEKGKRSGNIDGAVEQAEDRMQEARDNIRAGKGRDKAGDRDSKDDGSSDIDYEDDEPSEDDASSDDRSDDVSADDRSDDVSADDRSDDNGGRRADGMRGNAKAEEMRNRRDERKQIKEAYRADREPGQERAMASEETADGESAAKKSKKPWWKFWDE